MQNQADINIYDQKSFINFLKKGFNIINNNNLKKKITERFKTHKLNTLLDIKFH